MSIIHENFIKELKTFAAEKEREACAKIAGAKFSSFYGKKDDFGAGARVASEDIAQEIRARGEK